MRWYRQAGRNPIYVGFCLQGEGGREVVKVKGNFLFFLSQGCERERKKRDRGSSMTFDDRLRCGVVDYLKIITCRVEQGSGWLINGGIRVGELRSAVSDFWLLELRAGWLRWVKWL